MKAVAQKYIEIINRKQHHGMAGPTDQEIENAMELALDEIFIVLQSIQTGISSDPRKDARVVLRKALGEVSGYGEAI